MSGQYSAMGFRGQKWVCAVCGLPFYKEELTLQRGKWVCDLCDDEEDEGVRP